MYQQDDTRGQLKLAIASTLPDCPPFPNLEFDVVVIDPPWEYNLRESDSTHRGRTPYPNMDDQAILNLPVSQLCKPASYLFLWTTKDHLFLAGKCLESWGFNFKQILIWFKTTNDLSKIRFSTGHYLRNATEFCLIATKGKPPCFSTLGIRSAPNVLFAEDLPEALFAPRTEHSRKPEAFYQLVEKIPGDRLELFAREEREGWTVWGNEVSPPQAN